MRLVRISSRTGGPGVVLDGRKKVIDNYQGNAHTAAMRVDFSADNCAGGKQFLRVAEAAAMLNVHQRTVWRMIADGQLKAVHIRGCTRVYLSSVEEYLKGQNQVVGV